MEHTPAYGSFAEVWRGWVLSVVVGIVCPIGGVDQGEGGSGRVGDPRDSPSSVSY
jgi:hypothetical protein